MMFLAAFAGCLCAFLVAGVFIALPVSRRLGKVAPGYFATTLIAAQKTIGDPDEARRVMERYGIPYGVREDIVREVFRGYEGEK